MKLPKSPTYYLMLESYHKAINRARIVNKTSETADSLRYDRIDGDTTLRIFQNISVVDQGLLSRLEADELKLVIKIIDDLKMNNALWYYDTEGDSNKYKPIRKLIDREILKKTEDKTIFVVNPQFLRRGTITSVLAETMKELSTSSRVNRNMIHDLNHKNISINQIDSMDGLK